ncbi:MAG: ZIP family metal transporter [Fuerstiella sp.]|nr:ZIP family metal transporter [Fuerstiella sp.]
MFCLHRVYLFVIAAVLTAGFAAEPVVAVDEVQGTNIDASVAVQPERSGVEDLVVGVTFGVDKSRTMVVLGVYCLLIVAASLAGGWLPSWIELTHTRMQTVISFVGGLMLGIGVFHLLPHAFRELRDPDATARWMMLGIVMMFVLIRLFHFHNHEPVASKGAAHSHHCDNDHDNGHDHAADHGVEQSATGEGHGHGECHSHGHSHGLSWIGIAIGLSLHTLIDGLALGASVQQDARSATGIGLFGIGTFVAVLLHKPLDAVSITSLMAAGGWNRKSMGLVNAGFAMMCPLGAVLFLLGISRFPGYQQEILGTSLAFAAGVFVCIALSDLLPEMEFHSHNRVQLTIALAIGIVVAWAVTLLEPAHLH